MALRYIDSMGDHYTDAPEQVNTKWTDSVNTIREAGLHGYGMRGYFLKGMLFGSTTIIQEVYIKRLNVERIFSVRDTSQTMQIWCAYNDDGSITVSRYGSDPAVDLIAQTAPDLIRAGTWYHFGWRVFVHPSAGSVEVRLNGGTVINVTGVKTTTSLSTSFPQFWTGAIGAFSLGANSNATVFDDLVVMDDVDDGLADPRLPGSGGFDQFLGPVIVAVKRPNAPGLAAAWTPVPSSNANWDNVNDTESDDDATYNVADASAVGASDLFEMENLLATEDILGAQSLVLARKTDDGIAAIAKLIHTSGVTTPGATIYQPNSYAYMHAPEPTLPDGSLWTAAKWNAIQVGYKRIV